MHTHFWPYLTKEIVVPVAAVSLELHRDIDKLSLEIFQTNYVALGYVGSCEN